jgi:hypothetical protein
MGRIVVSEFVTLDGVIEDPGGSEKSPHGGGRSRSSLRLAEARTAAEVLLLRYVRP